MKNCGNCREILRALKSISFIGLPLMLCFQVHNVLASHFDFFDSEGNEIRYWASLKIPLTDELGTIMSKYDGEEFAKKYNEYVARHGGTPEDLEEASLSGWKVFLLERCPNSPAQANGLPAGLYKGILSHKIVQGDAIIIACYFNVPYQTFSTTLTTAPSYTMVTHGHYIVYDLVTKKKKREGWQYNNKPCGVKMLYDKNGKLSQTVSTDWRCPF